MSAARRSRPCPLAQASWPSSACWLALQPREASIASGRQSRHPPAVGVAANDTARPLPPPPPPHTQLASSLPNACCRLSRIGAEALLADDLRTELLTPEGRAQIPHPT